jgi:hypothetical protein
MHSLDTPADFSRLDHHFCGAFDLVQENTSVLITAITNSDKSSSQDRHQLGIVATRAAADSQEVAAILEAVEQPERTNLSLKKL